MGTVGQPSLDAAASGLGTDPVSPASGLVTLHDESLRQQAVRAIRSEIISGTLQAGVVYSARALAVLLGVSATPVREAMLDLAKEGLVTPVRNRGFEVVTLSDRDLDEILELRLGLEVPNIRRLAGLLSHESVATFANLANEITEHARNEDLPGFLDADRRFHLGLLGLVGNTRLVELVAQLRDQSRLYGLPRLLIEGSLVSSAEEHGQILAALVRGDAGAVESIMQAHLKHTRGQWAGRPE